MYIRAVQGKSKTTYEGTLEELCELFRVECETLEELIEKLNQSKKASKSGFCFPVSYSKASRPSKSHITASEEIEALKMLAKEKRARLEKEKLDKAKRENRREIFLAVEAGAIVQAGKLLKPGLFKVEFSLTQVSDEALDFLYESGLILQVQRLKASEIDLGDYVRQDERGYIVQEQSIVPRLGVVVEYFEEY